MPESLSGSEWELPNNFLGLDEASSALESSSAVILPVPWESTTSYGSGTRGGPAAILAASRYIELYDQELDAEPSTVGVATLPALTLGRGDPGSALRELERAYGAVLDAAKADAFVIALGGEHAISGPLIRTWADRVEAGGLSVLQIDAHADLRPEYGGTPHSHASVMYQVRERVGLVGVGIRALTREERDLVRASDRIDLFLADDIQGDDGWIDDVLRCLTDSVYISFDVDGFDPSLVPATGTPEPGGLGWYPVLKLLRRVFAEKRVVAADVVELAPIPGLHAPDFLVAKLVYKLIGYRFGAGS
ncbi:MAG: agmatinase [Longimicrobiales bacterium]